MHRNNSLSHQEYSYCGAQCQWGSLCFQGWMGCSHPTVEILLGYLYAVALGQEAKLGAHTFIHSIKTCSVLDTV